MSVRILIGDCRDRLRELPDASVHTCVTSPPYFGLRDYGVDRQMGLEPTPDEFVAGMVDVFREVHRVLRDDGTCWINIGDSYSTHAAGKVANPMAKSTLAGVKTQEVANESSRAQGAYRKCAAIPEKNLLGIPWMLAFALRQPWTDWQIKDEAMRGWVAGLVDGEGCITIQQTKSSHSESLSFPPIVQVKMCDREPLDRLVAVAGSKIGGAQFPPSHAAANQRPSWQWKVSAERAAKIIAEIYPFLTCKRKQAIVAWNHQQFRTQRGNQARAQSELEREQFCKALINDLNQRRAVDLPSWMIEPKIVQEPGWYLRQDCIWSKPNPMPESVRDRCTKAHEHIFLLSKSPRYYFDADAISERVAQSGIVERPNGSNKVAALCDDFGLKEAAAVLPGASPLVSAADARRFFEVSVRLAAAILDLAQPEDKLSLLSLDPQVRQKRAEEIASSLIGDHPIIRWAASKAAGFAHGDIPAEEFLHELHSLWITLPNGDQLKEAWRFAFLHVGHVDRDGDGAVGVNNASDVSEIGVFHASRHSTSGSGSPKKPGRAGGDVYTAKAFKHPQSEPRGSKSNFGDFETRNKRSVWEVATQPFSEAHFATFPPALIEPCILAGCPVGGTVLDPFFGAGTTGLVADRLGRNCIGIELNPEYAEIAERRITGDAGMFADVRAA